MVTGPENNNNDKPIISSDGVIEGEFEVVKDEVEQSYDVDYAIDDGQRQPNDRFDTSEAKPEEDKIEDTEVISDETYDTPNNDTAEEIAEEIRKRQAEQRKKMAEEAELEQNKVSLSEDEAIFLRERILGRENAVDGMGSTIILANGMQLLDTVMEIKGQLSEFVGYINESKVELDEETATAIILTAKEKGWDSVDVQGTDEEKELLAKIAIEHGLTVSNYELQIQTAEMTQDAGAVAGSNDTRTDFDNDVSGAEKTVYNGVVSPNSNFANDKPQTGVSQFLVLENDKTDNPRLEDSKSGQAKLEDDKKDQAKLSGPNDRPSLPPPNKPSM